MNITKYKKALVFMCLLVMSVTGITGYGTINARAESKVDVTDVITSSEIVILGFQMRTDDTNISDGLCFRTVTKAPKAGSTINAGGKDYIVKNMGTIYVLDTDYSGISQNSILDETYTILNPLSFEGNSVNQYYIGAKTYNGINRTYGYIATDKGVMEDWNPEDSLNTYHMRTMTKMDGVVAHTMHVRAFVVATDGTIIYGEETVSTSVAKIAYQLYINSKTESESSHEYLYNNILHSKRLENIYKKNPNYPFYMKEPIEYGWYY